MVTEAEAAGLLENYLERAIVESVALL